MLSLSDYIAKEFTVNGTKSSRIILFDVDDTLIHTTAQIHIKKNGKLVKKISNAEYNEYKLGPGEEFDYSEFDDPNILDNEAFTKYWKTLKREYRRGTHIGILTARGDCDMIFEFFKKKGIEIKRELVFAIGDPKMGLRAHPTQRRGLKSTPASTLRTFYPRRPSATYPCGPPSHLSAQRLCGLRACTG